MSPKDKPFEYLPLRPRPIAEKKAAEAQKPPAEDALVAKAKELLSKRHVLDQPEVPPTYPERKLPQLDASVSVSVSEPWNWMCCGGEASKPKYPFVHFGGAEDKMKYQHVNKGETKDGAGKIRCTSCDHERCQECFLSRY